jgi:hypothetical protein
MRSKSEKEEGKTNCAPTNHPPYQSQSRGLPTPSL